MQRRRHLVASPASVAASLLLLLLLLPSRGASAWTGRVPASRPPRLASIAGGGSGLGPAPPRRSRSLGPRRESGGIHRSDGSTGGAVAVEPRAASRRSFLARQAAAALAAASAVSGARPAAAAEDGELIDVYFGCGCFWHVQHEFVEAERRVLGRTDGELTSRAGYAGGRAGALDGKVCYHNAQNVADYGKLGHAEVVSLRIPSAKFFDFAVEYCKLFDKSGFRPDQFGDRGTEYRNLVGIPGGKSSPLAEQLVKASLATGDKLDFAVGKGDDRDLAKVAFIMDTAEFPSFVAERYHQFHDGFKLDENYPNAYNSLGARFAQGGEDFGGCPNGMMGIGIGGL